MAYAYADSLSLKEYSTNCVLCRV